MKRPPQSFVVEHKRRPRRASGEPASIWSDDVGRELRGLLSEDAPPPADAVEASAAAMRLFAGQDIVAPKRILEAQASPSIEAEPLVATPAPPAPRPRGRPRKVVAETLARPVEVPVEQPVEEAVALEEAADESPDAPRASNRPSFRTRRSAARKALPLADRWRWNLRY
ncbi:hypothetical protein [Aureimonas psammosilenae]|uniref:hypothetical protein n=1 Tax=Aureimonas psammosilenae TaxID=2495496 RepID=UPI0012612B05|nr:hypothetical protein [Aureimonas psammosilenae]